MKIFTCLLLAIISFSALSQTMDDTDIFEVNKEGSLILKPIIEASFLEMIEPKVQERLTIFNHMIKPEKILIDDSKELMEDVYHFAEDTIRIHVFVEEFQNSKYSAATTTMGINWISGYELNSYENILNNYYKKALAVLQLEMEKKLVESQRIWLAYYLQEKSFIYELNDFGNHNSAMNCWFYYINMLESRVYFIRDIYLHAFGGDKTYKN